MQSDPVAERVAEIERWAFGSMTRGIDAQGDAHFLLAQLEAAQAREQRLRAALQQAAKTLQQVVCEWEREEAGLDLSDLEGEIAVALAALEHTEVQP